MASRAGEHRLRTSRLCRWRLAAVLGLSLSAALWPTARAGDILRGGATTGSRPTSVVPNPAVDAATEQARANAQDALARTTRAVESVRALQDTARDLARRGANGVGPNPKGPGPLPTVPNGLGPGGLQVAPGVPKILASPQSGEDASLWQGAKLPVQFKQGGSTRVTVEQLKQQALLTWETFNIGKNTTLEFNQARGGVEQSKWIAFNKVEDPSGAPSQILGAMKAPGQVYVINRNGIIFGGAAQINLSTLTASTLPINDNLVARGLLNNPNGQFLFSALPLAAGSKMPAFHPVISDPAVKLAAGVDQFTFAEPVAINSGNAPVRSPEIRFRATDGSRVKLIETTDYAVAIDAGTRRATVTLTPAGLAKVGTGAITATYTPVAVKAGDVVVRPGAQITSTVSAEGNGGRVLLVGANVRNEGTISTPAGQTILAAGLQLGLDAHKTSDPSLRGLDAYVGAVSVAGIPLGTAGTVTNRGLIEVPRGNVTMIGKNVEQLAAIESSTTTALNGRIDLLADYGATTNPKYNPLDASQGPIFLNRLTGTVKIGPASVTRILPEFGGEDRAVGTSLAIPSQIKIEGQAIHFAGGSEILAPNANVTVNAGNWVSLGDFTALRFTGGQIYFDGGAQLNVAGSIDIAAPITQNILTLQLRGAELANSPLQRQGLVRGVSITVDARRSGIFNGTAWVGTPLGDVSGYVGIIERNVGQLTVAGGTVNLNAGESVIMQRGSRIDVSGGWTNFEGGMVQTTRLISDGVLFDIADATPDRIYQGIYTATSSFTSLRYGITETFAQPLPLLGRRYEAGYLQGANAGSIAITAPSMALDGTLLGRAVQGPRQSNATTAALAQAGSLTLNFQAQKNDPVSKPPYANFSPTPPVITFDSLQLLPPAAAFSVAADGTPAELREERKKRVVLSPGLLTEGGFATLSVDNSDGTINLPANVSLKAPLRGAIALRAANMNLDGNVSAPGGSLSFSVFNTSPFTVAELKADASNQNRQTPPVDPQRGVFTLGPQATLSTAGTIADHRPGADSLDAPPVIDGGSISINAFTARLKPGSTIDVSGGVSIGTDDTRTYGVGGSLAILAGREPNPDLNWRLGGELVLGSTLKGYSGLAGGALTVQAPLIQVGGRRPTLLPADDETGPYYLIDRTRVRRDELLHLTPDFFSTGGFTSYSLNGIGKATDADPAAFLPAITIAPNTRITPRAQSALAMTRADEVTLEPFLKPEGLRPPVSLAFGTPGTRNEFTGLVTIRGDFVMGEGAKIATDPTASVTVRGDTAAILGSIAAPGGTITISGATSFPTLKPEGQLLPLPTVYLGPRSVLSTAGRLVLTPDPFGRRTGTVLPGGTITVSGNIVAQAGALLDVSGSSGSLDLAPTSLAENIPLADSGDYRPVPVNSGINSPLFSLRTVPTTIDSDGGRLVLQGAQELFTDATLRGFAGGPTARGGVLMVSSGRFTAPGGVATLPTDVTLIVSQSGRQIPTGYLAAGQTAIGRLVPTTDAGLGRGHFAASAFLAGGFDALKLSGAGGDGVGAVQFSGPVSIAARDALSVSDGGVIYADAAVNLRAPYVALGTPFEAPLQPAQLAAASLARGYFLPTSGPGSLTVRASVIDLGNLSLQNISRATFLADGGDIRGNGTLNVAGEISMRAGQVYPTTAGRFTIAAYDPNIMVAASSTGSNSVTLASAKLPPGFGVGSPLLGSTVAAINGTAVTLAGNANATITFNTPITFAPGAGMVKIAGSGLRPLPLSAGGTLNVYGSNIIQGGTLRAPFGTINLGWDGTGASPFDYLSGAGLPGPQAGRTVATTRQLTLRGGSVTSVAGIDPFTGEGVVIPYGFNANGIFWIDPTGIDITASGPPVKAVNLFGMKLAHQAGSLIDVRGAGDLYASRFAIGNGGGVDLLGTAGGAWDAVERYTAGDLVTFRGATWSARRDSVGIAPSISLDWTLVPQSFAVLPGYALNYSPFATFNRSADPLNLAAPDPGYLHPGLTVGDRIYLGASPGLAAGHYTLLPARYALLPGAFLVTPQGGAPLGTFLQPEGASFVSGYRFNDRNPATGTPLLATRFEVASSDVLRNRAQYEDYFANQFIHDSALALGAPMPRLPADSGRVVLSGLNALSLEGNIAGRALGGGHDAQIDISSLADIFITGKGGSAPAGSVVLNAAKLSSLGAESLLIGGLRVTSPNGTTITVKTGSVTVDNAGTPLTAPEIILVAKNQLTLAPGAKIEQSGSTRGSNQGDAGTIRLGDAAVAGSGNGLLLRASDRQVAVVRAGLDSQADQKALAQPPVLTVGAGASVSGAAVILDSTYGTELDPNARLSGQALALNSGQISIALDNPGTVEAIAGVRLSGAALDSLQSFKSLSLLSYSSLDLYGTGSFQFSGALALNAGEIRGFNNGGGTVTIGGAAISLGNQAGAVGAGSSGVLEGTLLFDTGSVRLGAGAVRIDQFATVDFNTSGTLKTFANGSLETEGALTIAASAFTSAQAVNYAIKANRDLVLGSAAGGAGNASGGLGATLSFTGSSITANTNIILPSGSLSLRATTGALLVGNLGATRFDVGGTERTFNDLTRYTDGGRISIVADQGSVTLGANSLLTVAAAPGGGNAGSVAIGASNGTLTLDGKLDGRGGAGGKGGSFTLDVKSLPAVSPLDGVLNDASFALSRTIRVRSGDVLVDGLARSQTYRLAADQGSIVIGGGGLIDASGATGGDIGLAAFGGVTLQSGARLTVAADDFNAAGKGGSITIEAGVQQGGVVGSGTVDLQGGATIDLSVASVVGATPAETAARTAAAAALGKFTGKLHLRAPQNGAGTDLLVDAIDSTIVGASSILVEGYRLFDLTSTGGTITNSGAINALGGLMTSGQNVQGSINANGQLFLGAAGSSTPNYLAMTARLLANNAGLEPVFVLAPGAEVIHRDGNLTLGATNSNTTSDWNLSTFRYGAKRAPGVLTLRASGDLVFFNALSDGFTPTLASGNPAWLYQAQLTAQNSQLPVNTQSWSYRLASGADLTSANFREVRSLEQLGGTGSLRLGKIVVPNNGDVVVTGGLNALTATALAQRYQVIRTGSGDIEISSGRDVQLLNQFATIYTAGTRTADPTLGGNFQLPPNAPTGPQGNLGANQQTPPYPAQYSLAGGNVTITAQQDIKRQKLTGGVLVADSQKQIPNNWLYRRGYVDPATGQFGVTRYGEIGSTTWWVDFSNFFQGVGTLGGGTVALTAGGNVSNVDAVAATNGRVTFQTPTGDRLAANQSLVELGGGDVIVRAGRDIDAGIYYVERGRGTLAAANRIITNQTRTASLGSLDAPPNFNPSPAQWLPTTLFLGKGSFDVSAGSDLLLGPVVNPFLLPGGVNNAFWRKSYFSTYAPTSAVNVSSLGGTITLRQSATAPGLNTATPILQNWMEAVHLLSSNPNSVSLLQPWLRLSETKVSPFATVFSLGAPTLRATAFSGDINLVGRFNLAPSPTGTIELAASGAINGLQVTGLTTERGTSGGAFQPIWGSATINLSDASPAAIPGINNPFAYQSLAGVDAGTARETLDDFLLFLDQSFAETGSSTGAAAFIQTQQALHGTSLLHAEDREPIRLYAGSGDISGLTLFSGKVARVVAGRDISDVALYIQNTDPADVSVVSSGRDIIAYNGNTPSRVAARAPGNLLNDGEVPLAGDLQISGPGTFAVLAGRNLDLGNGENNPDGTGVGLTSIGNARNVNLPKAGADIIAAAGVGPAAGLASSSLDFQSFIQEVVEGPNGERYLKELKETRSDLPEGFDGKLEELDPELRAKLALEIFYLVLRDAGRERNAAGSAGEGGYEAGFEAIRTLFKDAKKTGNIETRARDIRTKNGGNISLLAPGGKLTLTTTNIGTPLAPPGIITEAGGNISIFTDGDVNLGISRIFTLRGGNQIIWSSNGDIAAGAASKTVASAPPTRVLIDPQTATVETDLAGLATGGGIGVLTTVKGVLPGSVDLIAPKGVVDAGDAGIRASGDLNIAAVQVLNADNIQAAGATVGVPTTPTVAAPSFSGLGAGNAAAATNNAAADVAKSQQRPAEQPQEVPSVIVVEAVEYDYSLTDAPGAAPAADDEGRRDRGGSPAYRATVEPPPLPGR